MFNRLSAMRGSATILVSAALAACSNASGAIEQKETPDSSETGGSSTAAGSGGTSRSSGGSHSSSGGTDQGSGGTESGTGGTLPGSGGTSVGSGGSDDGLGRCSGTADECEAAREFNAYRIQHFAPGECNNVLQWHDALGKFAHDWALKTFSNPEHSFGPYGESLGNGDDIGIHDMVFFVSEYDPPGEDHCAPDGSFVASHHCNTMRCDAFTIGVGVVRRDQKLYIVVEFGGEDGASI